MRKPSNENERLAALQKSELPQKLILSYFRFDADRIKDIIRTAAKFGITLNNGQAIRYAIRHCQLREATEADFSEIVNEDIRHPAKGN